MKLLYIGYSILILFQVTIFWYSKQYIQSNQAAFKSYDLVRTLNKIEIELDRSLYKLLISTQFKNESFMKNSYKHLENAGTIAKLTNVKDLKEIEFVLEEIKTIKSKKEFSNKDLVSIISIIEKNIQLINEKEQDSWRTYIYKFKEGTKNYQQINSLINWVMGFVSFILFILFFVIKKLKSKQDEIQKMEYFTSNLVKTLNEAIFVTDKDGMIISCNTSASILLGKDGRKIIGKSIQSMFYTSEFKTNQFGLSLEKEPFHYAIKNALNISSIKIRSIIQADVERWYLMNGQPIFSGKNDGSYTYLFSFNDVTENILSQQKIEEQNARIRQSSQFETIGQMAGGIAHEINNPLFIIGGHVDLLNMKAKAAGNLGAEEIESATSKISSTIDKVGDIVKGLLALSRNDSVEFETTNLKEVIEMSLDFTQLMINKNNIDVEVDWESVDLELNCYPIQVSQVLINLIKNSVQAIETNDKKWIKIYVCKDIEDKSRFKLFLQDSGTSLTNEMKDKILMPYFTTKKVGEGTGLGLNICQNIINAHQGTITVSREHLNTTFVIDLPFELSSDEFNSAS